MNFQFYTFEKAFVSGFSSDDVDLDVWPRFLNQDPVGKEYYTFIVNEFASFHCVAFTEDRKIAGTGKILPFFWNENLADLPAGWSAAVLKSIQDNRENRICNSATAWSIEVLPEFRGTGLSHRILSELKKNAALQNIFFLFACVRPNQKEKFPFLSMDEYLKRKRKDGFSEDPWIRVHEKAGGKRIRTESNSMLITGAIDDWEEWTGIRFPKSGEFVISGGLVPVKIDREQNLGEYMEPNVWFQHFTR